MYLHRLNKILVSTLLAELIACAAKSTPSALPATHISQSDIEIDLSSSPDSHLPTNKELETYWLQFSTSVTAGNADEYLERLYDEHEKIINFVVQQLYTSLKLECGAWDDQTDPGGWSGAYIRPELKPTTGIDHPCLAQYLLTQIYDTLSETDAGKIDLLDIAIQDPSFLDVHGIDREKKRDFLPEDWASLAIFDDATHSFYDLPQENLISEVRSIIEENIDEPMRSQIYRLIATQRMDPKGAAWAVEKLLVCGDSSFLPRWRPEDSLDEVVFKIRMLHFLSEENTFELIPEFLSKQGVIREEVLAPNVISLLESWGDEDIHPMVRTKIKWNSEMSIDLPFEPHTFFHNFKLSCTVPQKVTRKASCTYSVEQAESTTVFFQRDTSGGFKLVRWRREIRRLAET